MVKAQVVLLVFTLAETVVLAGVALVVKMVLQTLVQPLILLLVVTTAAAAAAQSS